MVYTRVAQAGLLQVPESAMEGHRASTEYYALLNARTSRGTPWAPPGHWPKPAPVGPPATRYGDNYGHACFGVAGPVERSQTLETGSPDREANMWEFAPNRPGFAGGRPESGVVHALRVKMALESPLE